MIISRKEIIKDIISSAAASITINAVATSNFPTIIPSVILFFVFVSISQIVPKTRARYNGKPIFACFFFCTLFTASINWALQTFPLKNAEQTITTLNMPLEGFVAPFIISYIKSILIPCFILSLLSTHLAKKISLWTRSIAFIILLCTITIAKNAIVITEEIPINDYIFEFNHVTETNISNSIFFSDHYVSADTVVLSKKEIPNNLILILAESIENFPPKDIPHIHELAHQGTTFYESDYLSGGFDIPGSVNTISATVSKTTGLPLFSVRNKQLRDIVQDKIHLKKVSSIYNLLQKEGYYNVFIQGSDAVFANTESYLRSHGINELYDSKNINEGHDVDQKFWQDMKNNLPKFNPFSSSISDISLFETSKKVLDTLSKKEHFTLSIATIDTHYPFGFYNSKCKNKPTDDSKKSLYKASLTCSSEAIFDFVTWIQQQDFAKNTTIAVIGDHLFMGNLADSLHNPSTKRKWISIFLNDLQSIKRTDAREFSSLDIAPTLIESIGFSINTHKLGFGVSLYSDYPTLCEELGKYYFKHKLKKLILSKEYLDLY